MYSLTTAWHPRAKEELPAKKKSETALAEQNPLLFDGILKANDALTLSAVSSSSDQSFRWNPFSKKALKRKKSQEIDNISRKMPHLSKFLDLYKFHIDEFQPEEINSFQLATKAQVKAFEDVIIAFPGESKKNDFFSSVLAVMPIVVANKIFRLFFSEKQFPVPDDAFSKFARNAAVCKGAKRFKKKMGLTEKNCDGPETFLIINTSLVF